MYGPISFVDKKKVWNEISSFILNFKDNAFLRGGDFNTILDLKEKIGGIHHLSQSSLNFRMWFSKHDMIDVPTSNGSFMWNNRRKYFAYIAEKLDRFFIIGELADSNFNFQSSILPITGSDHYPVRLELSKPHKPTRNPFKCKKI